MNRSVSDVLRGHGEVGEGALCSNALNFAPRKHTVLCVLKNQIVSRALKTLASLLPSTHWWFRAFISIHMTPVCFLVQGSEGTPGRM